MPVTLRQKENSSIFVARVGGISLLIKATQGKIKSQNPPHVCIVCVFALACLPPDVLSPFPPSLLSLSR